MGKDSKGPREGASDGSFCCLCKIDDTAAADILFVPRLRKESVRRVEGRERERERWGMGLGPIHIGRPLGGALQKHIIVLTSRPSVTVTTGEGVKKSKKFEDVICEWFPGPSSVPPSFLAAVSLVFVKSHVAARKTSNASSSTWQT